MLVLDGGNSLAPAAPLRARTQSAAPTAEVVAQRREKAELIADAWLLGGIDGAAVGSADWSLGSDWLREMIARKSLPVFAANLECDGVSPFPGGRVVSVGGRRVGLVGVTSGEVDGCVVSEPVSALMAAVVALGPTDVVIGLLPVELAVFGPIAEGVLGIDLAITGGVRPPVAGDGLPLFEAGSRGRQVSVLDLTWTGSRTWVRVGQREEVQARLDRTEARVRDAEVRVAGASDPVARDRFEKQRAAYAEQLERDRAFLAGLSNGSGNTIQVRTTQLGDEIADDPATAALVTTGKARVAAVVPIADPLAVPRRIPGGSVWSGSDTCAGCHPAEHAQWASTPHSHALGTLVAVQRASDERCWSCHVTGANQPGGPTSAAEFAPFRDVQCEACHGPSAAHVAQPAVVLPQMPSAETCTTCHDAEQDQGRFDFETYLPKVRHLTGGEPAPATAVP